MPTAPATPEPPAPPTLAGPVVLVIEPVPGDVPPAVRLKKLLKVMLRAYGWRCVHAGDRLPARVLYVERPRRSKPPAGS